MTLPFPMAVTGALLLLSLLVTAAGLWRVLSPLHAPALFYSYRGAGNLSEGAQRILADRAAPLGTHNTPTAEETDRAFRASLEALATLHNED